MKSKRRAKQKPQHGGRRDGAGRKPSLENPSTTIVRFEEKQLAALERFKAERKLPNRSAALRTLVDENLNPEESEHGSKT
jgi:hypothetical protein